MSPILVNYIQGLWKEPRSKPNKKIVTGKSPLRHKIQIPDPEVVDLSPKKFWAKHLLQLSSSSNGDGNTDNSNATGVTLVMGSLDRDRVDGKSCALYSPTQFASS